jgi:hypothetical protein
MGDNIKRRKYRRNNKKILLNPMLSSVTAFISDEQQKWLKETPAENY